MRLQEDDLLNLGLLWLAAKGGAFDWLDDEEDRYRVDDLKVRYRGSAALSSGSCRVVEEDPGRNS